MTCPETIKNYVETTFRAFGINKRRELTRLLFEIAKREKKDFRSFLPDALEGPVRFPDLKARLLKRRFPVLSGQDDPARFTLPELQIDPSLRVAPGTKGPRQMDPKNIYFERAVAASALAARLKRKYPKANFKEISSYKDHAGGLKPTLADYNRRLDSFYIIRENYDFFKRCPCSNDSASCGYHVINLGSGCAFDCHYCYLQDYLNSPGIILPANIEDFFNAFKNYNQNIRLGSGEYTDSLVFDHITEFSPRIVDFFKSYPKSRFEFKTKSSNIDLLLTARPAGNIIVSWTFSPQTVIDQMEWHTASLKERLGAAVRCAQAGYKIALHFDPVIYYKGWEGDYRSLIDDIFAAVPARQMEWISIGTLRMTSGLKKAIENRFPDNEILDQEFQMGYDGKFRYGRNAREEIYRQMKQWIAAHTRSVPTYLCMEEKSLARGCKVTF